MATAHRPLPASTSHLVIGAGFSGLCAAIKLAEAGEHDVVVVDKGPDVGGTWRDNTYPGAACDVPSQLYSFSFARNPDWSMSFSPQPEIQAYLQRVARESGLMDRFWFGTDVEDASYDDTTQRWVVRTSHGTVEAQTLIVGAGGLSEPRLPDIEGIESFGGEIFHSARWNHDVDLAGKRIAVIGTGASAIQIVPKLQEVAGHLDVYQRTAPWVIPRNDRSYTRAERAVFRRSALVQKAYRAGIYFGREVYVPAFAKQPKLAAPAKALALANIRLGIKDPELRRQVTPHFELGCKRVLISNTYYPALAADNTELVTEPISRITSTGVVTAGGTERAVDVLVVATGFHTTDHPIADVIHGRGGRSLAQVWRESGQAAYKGTTVHGFPNFFQLVGPNTTLGHSSMVFMIETQVGYVVDAIRTMREHRYATVEPKSSAQAAWNRDVQERMGPSVWNTGGCSSWYLDEHGRNTIIWPRTTIAFRRLLHRFDIAAYDVTSAIPEMGTPTRRSEVEEVGA